MPPRPNAPAASTAAKRPAQASPAAASNTQPNPAKPQGSGNGVATAVRPSNGVAPAKPAAAKAAAKLAVAQAAKAAVAKATKAAGVKAPKADKPVAAKATTKAVKAEGTSPAAKSAGAGTKMASTKGTQASPAAAAGPAGEAQRMDTTLLAGNKAAAKAEAGALLKDLQKDELKGSKRVAKASKAEDAASKAIHKGEVVKAKGGAIVGGAKSATKGKAAKGKGHVAPELTPALLKQIHKHMVTSRIVDEITIRMNRAGHGFFWIGGPGEEAFGTALAHQLKKGQGPANDYLHLHYRSNPILMAMGAKPIDTYRQMRGNQSDPYSGGRNFVNHYAVPEWNVVPVTPTIETQYLTAIGTAHVQRRFGDTGLTIVNGGDAGTAEGDFMCCLNWATRPGAELPMLIVVNHNGFGISTPSNTVQSSPNLAQRGEPYGIKWKVINGNDFFESWAAIAEAMDYIRRERKPYLIQANVSRLHGHSSATGGNREPGEDAITRFEARLIEQGLMTSKQCEAVWAEAREQGRKDLAIVLEEPLASDVDRFIFKEA